MRSRIKGVNVPMRSSVPGVSVIGDHIRTKSDPVMPLLTQARRKLEELKKMPAANLAGR